MDQRAHQRVPPRDRPSAGGLSTPRLTGQVAIVTGGSRGIGKGLALGLAAEGASVVCAARTEREQPGGLPGTVHATAEAVSAAGGRALAVGCDISRDDDIARLIGRTIDAYGRVDILVNNAMSPLRGRFEDTDVSVWDAAIATNIRSLLVLCQSVLTHMTKQGGGSIINISSGAAEHASTPYLPPGFAIYAMAKAAMERFTTASAPELAELGVAINALRPGAVKTELAVQELGEANDWSSWTTPDAVVPAVVFLAAERGGGFTGRIVDSPRFGKDWP